MLAEAVRLYLLALEQGDSAARVEAIRNLGSCRCREALEGLLAAWTDAAEEVRQETRRQLAGLAAWEVRREHEGKLVALLTAAQKKQWKERLGKLLDLDE